MLYFQEEYPIKLWKKKPHISQKLIVAWTFRTESLFFHFPTSQQNMLYHFLTLPRVVFLKISLEETQIPAADKTWTVL